jgi:hypothetical protein
MAWDGTADHAGVVSRYFTSSPRLGIAFLLMTRSRENASSSVSRRHFHHCALSISTWCTLPGAHIVQSMIC